MKHLFFILVIVTLSVPTNAQTVPTQYGPVTGHMNEGVYEFLGIPYASPPVGQLRWRPPVAPSVWALPVATENFPPKCSQKQFNQGDTVGYVEGLEDCLYLNVWSPDTSAQLPVMVFIHGGGNQAGSTSEISGGTEIYLGKNMADRGNIVLVTIQYRLGPLGYLAHPGLETESIYDKSGNYGVMDQIFALQWVQQNIEAFGGDPANVTIFGESAGGVNVGNLLTSPAAKGLFHKAIIQSAVPGIELYNSTLTKGINFINQFVGIGTDSAKIAYMRTLPADSMVNTLEHPIQNGVVQQQWRPTIDGNIFVDSPKLVFQSGNFNRVPLIIGSNAEEMSISVPPTVYPFMINTLIKNSIPDDYQSVAQTLYPSGSTNEEAREAYIAFLTDAQFTNTSRQTAQCVSLNQTEPVWRYFFTHRHNPSIPSMYELGAYHGMELFYVFNTWENSPLAVGPLFTAHDDSVQSNMLRYWVNFAYTGNPNDDVMPAWPQYDATKDCYLEIKATPDGNQCGLRTTESDFWDNVSGFSACTSVVGLQETRKTASQVVVYPNPVSNKLTVYVDSNYTDLNVTIFNIFSKTVLTIKNQSELDLCNVPSGTYFLRIEIDGDIITKKVVKVK